MKNKEQNKGLSRLAFLKTTGLAAAGISLPGLARAGLGVTRGAAEAGGAGEAGASGLSEYQIVVPAQAEAVEKQAAERLHYFLSALLDSGTGAGSDAGRDRGSGTGQGAGVGKAWGSGGSIAVVAENEFKGKKAIYIGRTDFAKTQNIDFTGLAADGYLYKPVGKQLIIAGGAKNGVLYGVYDLLEGLGFRKYSPTEEYIPNGRDRGLGKTVNPAKGGDPEKWGITGKEGTVPVGLGALVGKTGMVFAPTMMYRTTSYGQMGDPANAAAYTDWHKLSSRTDWGLFVHTFNTLVPPAEYGPSHPEYYSLINGSRKPGTQLCLSNRAVVDVLVANLKKKIAEKPQAVYWSVSQNDNDQYCRCEACTALNEKYGGVPSGSIVYFTNLVAKELPDRIISTLAYWYSRKAPKNITIEPNVNIMLCNIESRRQGPVYETDPAFSNDLKDWGALTKNILIWDYNIQFTNYFAPFPNLYTIKPNIKFYTDNHVSALFMQSNSEAAAEMSLLRSYLISKLMWTPEADENVLIDDFLSGYYGAAGSYIRKYIDTMHASLLASGFKLNIFGDPIDAKEAFLSKPMMDSYGRLFDDAENAVSGDPVLLRRVKTARLPIQYAAIQIGRTEIDTPRSLYQRVSGGIVVGKPEMISLVNTFVEGCKREHVKLVRERTGSPEHFQQSFDRIFTNMRGTATTKSFGKKIIPITQPNAKSKGAQGFTDGVFGSYEAWQSTDLNWIYYTGEHMDFVLDLGGVVPVNSVNMDFLNPQAQPDWHLMALPTYVSYALSLDGEKYGDPVQVTNPNNPNPVENPDISKISIQSFTANLHEAGAGVLIDNTGTMAGEVLSITGKAQFIKVHAESLLKTPSWHIRAGQPLSIYSDQIVVK